MTRALKIVFIIDSLGSGGAERSLVELLAHIRDLGADAAVVTFRTARVGFEEEAKAAGIRLIRIEETSFLARVRGLRNAIRTEAPDLVHTTLFNSDIAGRLATTGSSVKVSTSLVNTSYDPARYADPSITRWKLEAARHVDGWTARHLCDHFHAITEAVKDSSVEALKIDPDKIVVINRGRDSSRLGEPSEERRTAVRHRLGLDPDQPVLLNIGRHEYQKGQRNLIEAVGELVRDYPDLVLLIAGREGNVTAQLRSTIAHLGLEDNVVLLGHRKDVGDLLTAADVFVFPSVYEGLGGALLEAMMMRVPVVASDIPTFREVLGANYPLLSPTHPDSLAMALRRLIPDGRFGDEIVERNSIRVRELLAEEPARSLASQLVEWASLGR